MIEDAVEEDMDIADAPEEFEEEMNQAEEDLADIDELLDSDEDFFLIYRY